MSNIARWRSKEWEVSASGVKTLEDLQFSWEQQADNNSSTEDTALTNERGMKLFPLSFKTVLHAGTGTDVRQEIESWKELVTKTGILYLGGVPLGPKLQLRKVAVSGVKINNSGRMLYAELSLSFKEYDEDTTSVPDETSTSAQDVAPSPTDVDDLAPANKAMESAPVVAPATGTYVYPEGSETASQIEELSGNRAKVNGKWVDVGQISMA